MERVTIAIVVLITVVLIAVALIVFLIIAVIIVAIFLTSRSCRSAPSARDYITGRAIIAAPNWRFLLLTALLPGTQA